MKLVIDMTEHEYEVALRDGWIHSFYSEKIKNGTPLPQCKNCKHFETDVVATVDGIPLILGHEACLKWGDGCKTKEDGYCFMFEAKEVEE